MSEAIPTVPAPLVPEQLEFKPDELTAEEYNGCQTVEANGDLCMAVSLIARRATTLVDMAELWRQPVSVVHELYRRMARAALPATQAAMAAMRERANLADSIATAPDEDLAFFDQNPAISEDN